MNASPFKKGEGWWVLLTWADGEEEAGPFDDELDALEMAQRWEEDVQKKPVVISCPALARAA